ncbi:MAG: hypothetical protein ACR2LM_14405 [Pyrinomonadaceae bacterium]
MMPILRPGVALINNGTAPVQIPKATLLCQALVLLMALSFGLSSALAQDQKDSEVLRAKSAFTGKSLAQISLTLATQRPEQVSLSDKAILTRELPLLNDHNRVKDDRQVARLYARAEATLKFFHRYGVVDLILFRHPQPIVYNKPGVVLVISTEVLKIVGNDEAALAGLLGHELAHEYVALQMLHALRSGDLSKIRELELFCDAVAVVVLLNLGLDPAHYGRALERIVTHSQAARVLNDGSGSHPTMGARLKVISDISNLLRSRATFAQSRQ